MRASQKKLFEFLKDCERNQRPFTVDDVEDGTGLSEASVKTYLSKKLIGRWVERARDDHFRARNMLAVTPEEFEAHMSQKAVDAFASFEEWKRHLEDLVQLGQAHGYQVVPTLEDLVRRSRTGSPGRE